MERKTSKLTGVQCFAFTNLWWKPFKPLRFQYVCVCVLHNPSLASICTRDIHKVQNLTGRTSWMQTSIPNGRMSFVLMLTTVRNGRFAHCLPFDCASWLIEWYYFSYLCKWFFFCTYFTSFVSDGLRWLEVKVGWRFSTPESIGKYTNNKKYIKFTYRLWNTNHPRTIDHVFCCAVEAGGRWKLARTIGHALEIIAKARTWMWKSVWLRAVSLSNWWQNVYETMEMIILHLQRINARF